MEAFYVDVPFIFVVIFVIYAVRHFRKEEKSKEINVTDDMIKNVEKECDKFHLWWDETITPKYGIPFDSESENEKEDNE